MKYPLIKLPQAISPRMLIVSLFIHCILVTALIVTYTSSYERSKSEYVNIGRVKLVELPHPVEVVKKLKPEIISDVKSVERRPIKLARTKMTSSKPKTRALTSKSLSSQSEQKIQIRKPKREPLKIEAKKKKGKGEVGKKPEPESPKNPDEILKKRLAEIRQQLKNKHQKTSQVVQYNSDNTSDDHTRTGSANALSAIGDQQLAAWLEQVKQRINDNWSVLPHTTEFDKETVIGVKMAPDGSLLLASVESSSGDELFDRSAMRAVHQASPFPPAPPKAAERIRIAGGLALRFTPGGLR